MTCEEIELALSERPPALTPEVAEHLTTCASCRQTAQLLSLARLPELSAVEVSGLAQLPGRSLGAWRAQETRRFSLRRFAGYAVAAAIGALVASGVTSFRLTGTTALEAQPPYAAATLALGETEFDFGTGDDDLFTSDETEFFDVSWPALDEGEAQ